MKSEEIVIDSSSEANNVEAIIDDKSAVEEVFDGNQEAMKAVAEMSEKELAAMPTEKLVKLLVVTYNVDPSEYPGKNTNAKLRRLLMSAAKGSLEAPAQEPYEQTIGETKAEVDEELEEKAVTIDMCRDEARIKIKKDREAVLRVFKSCGCSTFATLREADYAKFYEAVKAI